MNLSQPIHHLKQKLSNKFVRNLGWLGAGELVVRISRLLTTVILARFLSPQEYGLAALVLTVYEFSQVFTRIGIGGKVIQADAEELEEVCNGAYWLNWAVCLAIFAGQCLAAFPVAWFYKEEKLILPICILALVYLVTPFGRIQAVLIQRENRMKVTAISSTVQMATANVLTAVFAVLGLGMWAIILPHLLSKPINIFFNLKYCSWRPSGGFSTKRWGEIFSFGIHFLGVALLSALRNNLDYLIIARFLGIKALGLYFFAFNAGLGISLSLIQSITTALYPHLCEVRSNLDKLKQRYISSLKTIASIIIPMAVVQSALAPIYVPIVFGQQWIPAIPVLILICLSAIPRPFFLASTNLLAAINRPDLSLRGNILFTIVFTVALLIGVKGQAIGVAISVLLTHVVFMPLFTMWANRFVFHPKAATQDGQ